MTNGLIHSVQDGRVTAFSFFRDRETKDAANALLILGTTPLDTTTHRDVHMANDKDDETIDAQSLSEQKREARTHTTPESEGSAYVGDEDFEIGTIRTEDGREPVDELISLNLPPNEEVGPGATYRQDRS